MEEAQSLSARRAWIEIVDLRMAWWGSQESLSARRAWIEMSATQRNAPGWAVALRKESVDRNKQVDGGGTVGQVTLRKESIKCFSF